MLKYIATEYNELNLLKLIIALIFLSDAKILKIFEKPNFSARKSALYLIFIVNKYIIAKKNGRTEMIHPYVLINDLLIQSKLSISSTNEILCTISIVI